jgi:hypothetical protein
VAQLFSLGALAMRGIHIFSPEIDRKIAWYGSVAFMVLAWLLLAGGWIWIVAWNLLSHNFSSIEWEGYCILAVYLFVVIMIPVQVLRYFREKRRLR